MIAGSALGVIATMFAIAPLWSQVPEPPATTPPGNQQQGATADQPQFKQEELDQMLAPIALYPDALLSQVFMAATYPLEIVEADRWAKAHKDLQGDALAKELEQEKWDPSVKSLVNFPPVLELLSSKLDWTQKLGDAFLGQQKQVMDTVQKLRAKAKANGKLESDQNQKVTVEEGGSEQLVVIESADPQVIYVPTYDPVVVYGPWWYPAYPPYPYYPPGYAARAFAIGVAWGYAWGHCDWHHCDVNINVNRNVTVNTHIDRNAYSNSHGNLKGGQGNWQHDAGHRGGVAYRDGATAQKFGGVSSNQASKARDAYRGRADAGRAEPNRGAAPREAAAPKSSSTSGSAPGSTVGTGSHGGALSGSNGSGAATRAASARGHASRGGGRR